LKNRKQACNDGMEYQTECQSLCVLLSVLKANASSRLLTSPTSFAVSGNVLIFGDFREEMLIRKVTLYIHVLNNFGDTKFSAQNRQTKSVKKFSGDFRGKRYFNLKSLVKATKKSEKSNEYFGVQNNRDVSEI